MSSSVGEQERCLHVDRRETAMSDRTADGTGKGKTRVQGQTAQLFRSLGGGFLDGGIDLRRACARRWW